MVVGFNCGNMSSLNNTLASQNPEMIYLVIQPANITPDFIVELEDVIKQIDNDPFLDAPYTIITANTSMKALEFFKRTPKNIQQSGIFISAYPSYCFPNSRVVSHVFPNNIVDEGPNAYVSNISAYFTENDPKAALYLCGESTSYNDIKLADDSVKTNGVNIQADTAITVDNASLFFLTSSSARISGTSTSLWAIALNESADYGDSFPVVAAESAANYFGFHSTKWLGFEYWLNQFFIELANGTSSSQALETTKNLMLFNKVDSQLNDLVDFMETNMILFGKSYTLGNYINKQYQYHISSKTQLNSTIPLNQSVWLNATFVVEVLKLEKIVENNNLVASNSTLWMINVSQLNPTTNTVNISFVSAVTGEIIPDAAIDNVVGVGADSALENLTRFWMDVNNSFINLTGYDTLQNTNVLRVMKNNKKVYFALLSNPNETKNNLAFNINVVYTVEGPYIERETISAQENRTTVVVSIKNPSSTTFSNVSFLYPLPNASQIISVSQDVSYSVFENATGKYIELNISSLAPGKKDINIVYESPLKNNGIVFNQTMYDRGDAVGFSLNLSFNYTNPVDVLTTIYDPMGKMAWSNISTNITIADLIVIPYDALTLNSSYPAGSNSLVVEVYDNDTGMILNNFSSKFKTTNKLMLVAGYENITFTHTNHSQTGETENWYFTTNDYVNLTGSVVDWNGTGVKANLTLTLYLPTSQVRVHETDANGAYSDVQFSWSNAPVGSYVLNVYAEDSYNNSVEYNKTLYITRFLNHTLVAFNITSSSSGNYIFNDEDKIYIIVKAYDENDQPVYHARVSIVSPQISSTGSVTSASTDENGEAVLMIIPEASDKTYKFNISVYSPLNITKIIYNASLTAYVKDVLKWNYDSQSNTIINYQSPKPAVRDQQVVLRGNLTLTSGSSEKISEGSIKYVLEAGGSDVKEASDCTDYFDTSDMTFEIKCTPKMTDEHCLKINATVKYDGVYIYENNIRYCFDVIENTTASTTSTQEASQQQTLGLACSKDSDCAAGEYCHNGVCTALECDTGKVIYNHQCVLATELYKLDVIAKEKLVVEKGKGKEFEFVIENEGLEKQTQLRISLKSNEIKWGNWYSVINKTIDALEPGENVTVLIKLIADKNTLIDEYSFTVKVTSKEGGSVQKSFVFYVAPTQEDIQKLEDYYSELETTLESLKEELDKLLKKRNTSETRLASYKLTSAEKLLNEMKKDIEEGNYLEAYLKKNELANLLNDVELLVKSETQKMKENRRKLIKYAIIIIALGAFGFAMYYLWTLPPGYAPKRGYRYKPPSSPFESVISYLRYIKEKLGDLYRSREKPRYNFHRRKRWKHE